MSRDDFARMRAVLNRETGKSEFFCSISFKKEKGSRSRLFLILGQINFRMSPVWKEQVLAWPTAC